jgi:hypothetical protein
VCSRTAALLNIGYKVSYSALKCLLKALFGSVLFTTIWSVKGCNFLKLPDVRFCLEIFYLTRSGRPQSRSENFSNNIILKRNGKNEFRICNCINLAQSSLLTNRTQLWHYFQLNQIVNADHVRFDCFGFFFKFT